MYYLKLRLSPTLKLLFPKDLSAQEALVELGWGGTHYFTLPQYPEKGISNVLELKEFLIGKKYKIYTYAVPIDVIKEV